MRGGLVVASERGVLADDDDADGVGEVAVEDALVDAVVEDLFDLGGCWVGGCHLGCGVLRLDFLGYVGVVWGGDG